MNSRNLLCSFASGVALVAAFLPANAPAAPGDLYVTESISGTVLKFSPDGTMSTFASGLVMPLGLAFDRDGNLFVAQSVAGLIVKILPDGSMTTFASGLSSPIGLVFDGLGNLFVAESFGDIGSISKFTAAGVKSTFASGNDLRDLAFDLSGNLFVASIGPTSLGGAIIKFSIEGMGSSFAVNAGAGLAFNGSGHLFAADQSGSGGIAEFSPDGTRSVFTSAVDHPNGLAFDHAGNLFAIDSVSGNIFRFTPDGAKSTFASGLDHPAFLAFEPLAEKIRNISARGVVQTGDGVLIGGFIVGGNGLATNAVVARAIGPSLTSAGIADPLADPVLELHDASGALLATNDNWQDTQKAKIVATGLAPSDKKESAIFATLPAGGYTAIVRGVNNSTGIALVEIYSLSPSTGAPAQ